MSNYKEHKHASVLRAIADGVPMSEFEANCSAWKTNEYEKLERWLVSVISHPDIWEIRRKPQYIMVNGFKVPKPLDVIKDDDIVFRPDIAEASFVEKFSYFNKAEVCNISFTRGLLHSTKEAAIAHAKAMLGIDPKWEE